MEKAKEFHKNIYFCLIDYAKAFDCVDHNKLWKILKEMETPYYLTCLLRNLYVDQEATVRSGHRTTDWFKIGKGLSLALLHRCAAVADHAAAAFALLIIAGKIFSKHLFRNEAIVDLDDCSVIHSLYFLFVIYSILVPFSRRRKIFLMSSAETASIFDAYPVV